MLHVKAFAAATLAAVALSIASAAPAAAEPTRPRPPGSDYVRCVEDDLRGGAAESDCEGALCWCCYNNGCWICDNNGDDCAWDPGHASINPQLNNNGLQFQHVDPVNPNQTFTPQGGTGATRN